MTTFTHQLLSRKTSTPEVWQCECEYSSRSATVSVAVLRMGYTEVKIVTPIRSTRRKVRHHVTSCLAKAWYPTSRWDVAVTNGHCSRTVLPLTPPKTQKLAAWERSVHRARHFVFCLPNSPDLNTVNLLSGMLFSRRSTIIKLSFSQLTKWRERLSKAWQKLLHGAVIANNSSRLSHFI